MNNIAMLNIDIMLTEPVKVDKPLSSIIFERKTAKLTALREACVEYVKQHKKATASELGHLCQSISPEIKSQPSTIVRPAVRRGILVVNKMPRKIDCFYTLGNKNDDKWKFL
jgi:hypothetical protein